MGAFCCCPCNEEFEEYANPSNPLYRRCVGMRYFIAQLFNGRFEGRLGASFVQGATPFASTGLSISTIETSTAETSRLVPRPAQYDSDPRYSHQQREGLVSRREKAVNHNQDDSQMTRKYGSSSGIASKKRSCGDIEGECKSNNNDSEKHLPAKAAWVGYALTTSEDEDVCPTCLEEYSLENPKIVAKCKHHFHLGCIYEWMERSETCPVCGKEMEFCESP